MLGVRHAFVVHAPNDDGTGMDELSISGPSHIAEVHGPEIFFAHLTPEQLGLTPAPIESLRGGDAQTNAEILQAIFAGERGPRRDVVQLNTAAVLITAGLVSISTPDLAEAMRRGIDLAALTIDSGAVTTLVASLAKRS
jgi:anthranilate phosphoribosyltransferase